MESGVSFQNVILLIEKKKAQLPRIEGKLLPMIEQPFVKAIAL